MKFTNEEKVLLERMSSGAFDGQVGSDFFTDGGSVVWTAIKNGIPQRFKQGPSKRFFNGKENEIIAGVLHTLQTWKTDEEKIHFLRKFGFLIKDAAVCAYSAKFKPTR